MKKYFFLVFLTTNMAISQNIIDRYKYVIVPSQFSFLDQKDEYRLNTLTKLLLEKYGFKAYLDSEEFAMRPRESNCEALYADVTSSGNFVRTKLQVALKDCRNKIVYQSSIGSSKEKEYKIAYTQALRMAFESFSNIKKETVQSNSEGSEITEEPVKIENMTKLPVSDSNDWTYVVKKERKGYMITDRANSKFYLQLLATNNPSVFIGKSDKGQGVATVKGDYLIFEYYEDNILISAQLMVKFQ